MFADVDQFLRSRQFQFHDFFGFGGRPFKPLENQNDPQGAFRQRIWADAYYVADWMSLERLSIEKLEKLALLLHDLANSFDLAHVVLVEIDRRTHGDLARRYLEKLCGVPIEVKA